MKNMHSTEKPFWQFILKKVGEEHTRSLYSRHLTNEWLDNTVLLLLVSAPVLILIGALIENKVFLIFSGILAIILIIIAAVITIWKEVAVLSQELDELHNEYLNKTKIDSFIKKLYE